MQNGNGMVRAGGCKERGWMMLYTWYASGERERERVRGEEDEFDWHTTANRERGFEKRKTCLTTSGHDFSEGPRFRGG